MSLFSLKEIFLRKLFRRDPRHFLLRYIQNDSAGAEIGVWKGDFTKLVLSNRSIASFYLVDPWEFQGDFPDRMFGGSVASNQDDMDKIFESVQTLILPYTGITTLRKKSDEALADIPDASLDWVYIDGNHYYDYVLADLKNYFKKIRVGGHMLADDYNWRPHKDGQLEVKAAIEEFLREEQGASLDLTHNSQAVIKKLS